MSIGEDSILLQYSANDDLQIHVMGQQVKLSSDLRWHSRPGKIIPNIALLQKQIYETGGQDRKRSQSFWEYSPQPFKNDVEQALKVLAHKNTSTERLASIANRLSYADKDVFFSHMVSLPGMPIHIVQRITQLGADASELVSLRRAVLMRRLSVLLQVVDEEMDAFAQSVRYLEPIRATAERYYREQDLAVDEIDSRGTNIAMFLSSMSRAELADLREWMRSNFGFAVVVEASTGHVQIKIEDRLHLPRNIADLGFGYSQVLPIIIQLWRGVRQRMPTKSVMLAMEQPELHLHPHYQAMLADVIALTASTEQQRNDNRIFIETHSDHFINRLGKLVSEGKLNHRDLQLIVICESPSGGSEVKMIDFDSEGALGPNWPVGFFTPGALSDANMD